MYWPSTEASLVTGNRKQKAEYLRFYLLEIRKKIARQVTCIGNERVAALSLPTEAIHVTGNRKQHFYLLETREKTAGQVVCIGNEYTAALS